MTEYQLDVVDRKLLNLLQAGIPLVQQPFLQLSRELAVEESEVIERIENLKKQKVIRQISAIFDTKSLGYESSLVAASVRPERLQAAVEILNAHPGVSHNYERSHRFNVWFTIAIPPDSKIGLEGTVELLGRMAGVDSIRILPTLKLYKIGVKLDMESDGGTSVLDAPVYDENSAAKPQELTELDIAIVREAQEYLPIIAQPFDAMAEKVGISVAAFLERLQELQASGHMRRFAAVLHHRKAGFQVNAMGVWAVPDEIVDQVGVQLAKFSAVSHCYRRTSYADWPYTVFTMIHGRDRDDCENILREMAEATGIYERDALYSVREFKKVRVKYFTPEIGEWEKRYGEVK